MRSPPRVAFVMPGAGIVRRGAEAFVVELAAELARRHGLEVTLLCRGEVPVPHRRIAAVRRDARWLQRLYGASRLGRKILDTLFLDPLNIEWATAALTAFPKLWRGGYDVVVMEGGLVGAWLCRLLRALRGVPFLDIAHGVSPKWERAFARQRPDRVVVFTRSFAAALARWAPRARIEVIPHGVDLERFREDAPPLTLALQRPIVLAAGEIEDHKRLHLAVEAVAQLRRGSLVVLGTGPAQDRLDALASLKLGGSRYLRTRVPREEMASWYAAADCFTLPSVHESFGLVYLEAMACGLPCVAPDDAIRREVVGEAGVFCDVERPELYARGLRSALEREWGAEPRRRAERFPVDATVAAYARLLEEVVA